MVCLLFFLVNLYEIDVFLLPFNYLPGGPAIRFQDPSAFRHQVALGFGFIQKSG
jgi:hypothetical protein